jgi:arylformamidase
MVYNGEKQAPPQVSAASRWLDVSVPIHDGMVHWPDNPPVHLVRTLDMTNGDVCTVSMLSLDVHSGTHVDAPVHFIQHGAGIDALSIDNLIGPAQVIQIHHPNMITVEEIRSKRIRAGARVLFKTQNSLSRWGGDPFAPDYIYLTRDGARFLVMRRVRTVGIDYLSIGSMDDGTETHRELLGAGICIIEGLNLAAVTEGAYDLVCLPLKIQDGDGAPARVVLRPRSRPNHLNS